MSAIAAIVYPLFDDGPDLLYRIDDKEFLSGEASTSLRNTYINQMNGSLYRGVRDRRFVHAKGSLARYVCELAEIFEVSDELRHLFTEEDLAF